MFTTYMVQQLLPGIHMAIPDGASQSWLARALQYAYDESSSLKGCEASTSPSAHSSIHRYSVRHAGDGLHFKPKILEAQSST